MITFKKINLKNHPYYFFNDMINIKNFYPNLLSINKVSFKSNDAVIYNIKYITMKSLDHENIDSETPLYLIFNDVDTNIIKENDSYKCLIFASTNKNKIVLRKYAGLFDEIKNQIETINGGNPVKYKNDYIRVSLNSNDNDLPLARILSIPVLIIVVKSVF